MKKFIVMMLTVVLAFSLVFIVACNTTRTIRVIIYETPSDSPRAYNHEIGQDDLPSLTNGELIFDGWYRDAAYTKPFDPVTDKDIDDGAILYAKWKQAGAIDDNTEKVVVTLNPNYAGATLSVVEVIKGGTHNLTSISRSGYTFAGWFTQAIGGTQWTNAMPFTVDTTLYAHWTENSGGNQGGDNQGGGTTEPDPTGVMEKQVYDEATFDNKNLQQKMEACEDIIGLPSTGTHNALVVPVQFKGDTITQTQLNNLNVAFNGTSAQTGWESVKTYYQKSSYGKLNLTFDIQTVYQADNNAAYYKNYGEQTFTTDDGYQYTLTGSDIILQEVLAYYEDILDLTKYDTNGDGCIDAVYLIYSESVDWVDSDFYWAYVTWYYGENQYDGLDAYYYLFAGFDFMGADPGTTMPDGMIINAETYIHETGHLLGLDDYYDYSKNTGSDQGLGGADMMDWNKGDHGVYSKIMLGWLDPTIVTSTQQITIKSSQAQASAILIPLNWNNSYFCEYLLIDLYSSEGLNAMGAAQEDTILYDGAKYGVRIYHVSAWVNDPYNNDFGSFTDYNNSMSNIPLIKLIEADGETSKSTNSGWASSSDLWQAGDTFSSVFPQYMRNDGKTLNFDITITAASVDSATITVTFN